jgi:hypothetical protein
MAWQKCIGIRRSYLAQDPTKGFGTGGGTQFFLSNYKGVLEPIGHPFELGF